jgi:hypothetical protein
MCGTASKDDRRQSFSARRNPGRDFDLVDNAEDLDFLRGVYPKLSNDQLLELKERLDGYFEVALEVFIESHPRGTVDDDHVNS